MAWARLGATGGELAGQGAPPEVGKSGGDVGLCWERSESRRTGKHGSVGYGALLRFGATQRRTRKGDTGEEKEDFGSSFKHLDQLEKQPPA
jgi:hypothetical protein